MAGGGLTNSYRGQLDAAGRVAIPGVFFLGDAVCTTYPAAGRGVSLGPRQAQALINMLTGSRADLRDTAEQFDARCAASIKPWYEDHRHCDATMLRRFNGEDIDIQAPIPLRRRLRRRRDGPRHLARRPALPDYAGAALGARHRPGQGPRGPAHRLAAPVRSRPRS
jgi:2-polyprenyl-6-methoxyphenol hydroxylase-like FAD-dependent oxidoreductase